ncbi:hypothetical protein ORD22_06300 [Sporosarcina sp. GW1-11]|uniref:hypothetical protein n=1 Tax=Sporosarcina sp. GW1-11 TaxID=2899126 RepID=UPI00294E46E3|nr:hypothetical protein [Sporosarcina sp. GW1-11]MDV6377872.1 hypothetical protein [Sporosarcina sp. GW1-11]
MKEKKNTPAKMILFCVLFAIIVTADSLLVINSPYVFVRVLNLFAVIGLSGVIGAFIRDFFILKEKERMQQK